MIRAHPNLLLYGGGSQLFPQPYTVHLHTVPGCLKYIGRVLDHYRFLILSSMNGGQDGSNMSQHIMSFALAVKDEPFKFVTIIVSA